jgi:Dolichyl-phosphate-mannose-protein mannosyltransferase
MTSVSVSSSARPADEVSGRRPSFRFWLALVALVALALRAAYVLALAPAPILPTGDSLWYAFVSDEITLGHGFVIGHGSILGPGYHVVPTALHPPFYPLALAALRELGVSSPKHLLWLGPFTGTLTVLGLGLLGRAIAGARIGLVAASIAAVYPLLIVPDGALLSETLYGPAVILVLAAALALARHPSVKWAAGLGIVVGLAAMVRPEALALALLLGLPLAWRGPAGRSRAVRVVATVACALLVVAPWVVRNASVFGTFTFTTNDGITVANTNCASTFYGPNIGYIDKACTQQGLTGNEAHQTAELRSDGLRYARDHAGRLPFVVAARVARTWGLFHPFRASMDEGRNVTFSNIGVVVYYALALLALGGAWTLRARRVELWILLAPIVLTTIVAAGTYGSLRLRYLAELPLVLLAAVGAGAVWGQLSSRQRSTTQPVAAPDSALP